MSSGTAIAFKRSALPGSRITKARTSVPFAQQRAAALDDMAVVEDLGGPLLHRATLSGKR